MLVRYIGRRTPFHDALYRTNTVWNEPGDIREVEDGTARLMVANHPDVYEEVYPEGARQEGLAMDMPLLDGTPSIHTIVVREGDGTTRLLRDATLPVVRAWADERLGLQLPQNGTRKDILDIVENALIGDPAAGVEEQPEPAPEQVGGLAGLDAATARQQDAELNELLGE